MENEQDKLAIQLYFDDEKPLNDKGEPIDSVEVDVLGLSEPVQIKINNIIEGFKLPKTNSIGEPNVYVLIGRIGGEYMTLQPEKSLSDYGIKPGDELHLIIRIFGA